MREQRPLGMFLGFKEQWTALWTGGDHVIFSFFSFYIHFGNVERAYSIHLEILGFLFEFSIFFPHLDDDGNVVTAEFVKKEIEKLANDILVGKKTNITLSEANLRLIDENKKLKDELASKGGKSV